ncbi:DMT family transporter [Hydrogenophaga sp. RWCD_12]|uniref:DMT family transporter n=1 Tax=Hydrogenophaga sp. RWCD_12 TaxID=3391190 RepID=UPI003984F745
MSGRGSFWLGVAMLLMAALSWSTAGLFPRLVSTDMPTTLFWRSLLGGLTVLGLSLVLDRRPNRSGFWRLTGPEWAFSFLTALAMISFVSAFYFASVADVTFIYGAFPIITLVLSAWLLHTGIARMDVVCAVSVALGVVLILQGQPSLQSALGSLLSFVAVVMFALETVGAKRFPQIDMVKVTYSGAFLAALMVLPFARFSGTSAQDLSWLWLYGFLNIGVGFGLFLLGVRRVRTVLASLICMVEIPLAPMWAFALFGETVSRQSLVGGAVILVSVLVNLAWTAWRRAPALPVVS